MNRIQVRFASVLIALFMAGCATPLPPGAERGPHNTMAYDVLVETSPPGAHIEANGESIGKSPVHLKIFGDPDCTFHDFGSEFYQITAVPASGATNQFMQTRYFQTGRMLTPQDRIPKRVYFNMHQPPPRQVTYPVYVTPPPVYYGPPPVYYYGPRPYNYGPRFYFNF